MKRQVLAVVSVVVVTSCAAGPGSKLAPGSYTFVAVDASEKEIRRVEVSPVSDHALARWALCSNKGATKIVAYDIAGKVVGTSTCEASKQ